MTSSSKPLASTPPMGWNSWNQFGWNVSEAVVRETANAMIASGLKDCGYEYIVIDDCWSKKEGRDSNGNLVADPEKFPSGVKALATMCTIWGSRSASTPTQPIGLVEATLAATASRSRTL